MLLKMAFQELIVNSGINELFFDGDLVGERIVCWTRLSSDGATWILAASNGVDVWRADFQRQDLVSQCELSDLDNNLEKYFDIIKFAFETSTVSLVKVGSRIILQCCGQKTAVNFDLYEAKINDKKSEMRYLVFHLTDKVKDLEKSLDEANEALEGERSRGKDQGETQGFGFEPVRKGGPSVNLRRKQGSSLVNPNSKKAKKAKGISFE